jgi:DNA-binding NtrC family response regulator
MIPTRVLLVDDEVEFTDVLSERLRTRGLKVDISPHGEDALRKADEKTFDAVVLDLAMPGMDGIETLKRMLKRNPDLQVILLTGHGTLEKSVEAMRSGAMEFMEKPPDMDKLLDKITQAKETSEQLSEQRMSETLSKIMQKKGW